MEEEEEEVGMIHWINGVDECKGKCCGVKIDDRRGEEKMSQKQKKRENLTEEVSVQIARVLQMEHKLSGIW